MHAPFIRRCLSLAENGRGLTGINPMVGAVLLRDGKIIAEGFHSGFGLPHAECQLLEKFEQKIRSTDILYVNLEPCCHKDKKTPPCAQLIAEKGIKTVVFGMIDPNPEVAGKGIAFLRSHQVDVIGPVLPDECARLNRGFVSLMTQGRPWITLKSAQTADGRYANPDGSPLKITSEEQDRWAHEYLRARHDAILVGIGTVMADDPLLTLRLHPHPLPLPRVRPGRTAEGGEYGRMPYRIIFDPHFKIPLTSKVVNGEGAGRTMVVREEERNVKRRGGEEKESLLKERGVRVIQVAGKQNHSIPNQSGMLPAEHSASFDWQSLWQALATPSGAFHGISSILVEGGPRTWEMFRNARMLDEEVMLIGGLS